MRLVLEVLWYFINIAAIQNLGVLKQIWPTKSMGAYFWYVKIPQCGWMEHGLKDIVFFVQNHITLCTVVITSLLVRDKPLGVPASVKRVYWDTIMAAHMYNRDSIYVGCCNMLMPSHQFRQGPPCPPSIRERLLNHWGQGSVSIRKTVLPGMAIPMLKIRRPNGRLIFHMEIAIRS